MFLFLVHPTQLLEECRYQTAPDHALRNPTLIDSACKPLVVVAGVGPLCSAVFPLVIGEDVIGSINGHPAPPHAQPWMLSWVRMKPRDRCTVVGIPSGVRFGQSSDPMRRLFGVGRRSYLRYQPSSRRLKEGQRAALNSTSETLETHLQ